MATVKLVGADDGTANGWGGANYAIYIKFQAILSGTLTELKVKTQGNENVKVAVYDDNAGSPGNLLENKTVALVGADFHTIPGWSVPITSGSYYWLGINSDVGNTGAYSSGGIMKTISATYATWTWPDPWANGSHGDSAWIYMLAGWGIPVVVVGNKTAHMAAKLMVRGIL